MSNTEAFSRSRLHQISDVYISSPSVQGMTVCSGSRPINRPAKYSAPKTPIPCYRRSGTRADDKEYPKISEPPTTEGVPRVVRSSSVWFSQTSRRQGDGHQEEWHEARTEERRSEAAELSVSYQPGSFRFVPNLRLQTYRMTVHGACSSTLSAGAVLSTKAQKTDDFINRLRMWLWLDMVRPPHSLSHLCPCETSTSTSTRRFPRGGCRLFFSCAEETEETEETEEKGHD